MNRILVPAAALAALLGTVPAATALSCPFASDPAGDGRLVLLANPAMPNSPALDLLSLDVASGRSTVVLALRVADVAPAAPDPFTTPSVRYAVSFDVGGVRYTASLSRNGTSDVAAFHREGVTFPAGGTVATVDSATSTITWTVDRALLDTLHSHGEFSAFAASSYGSFATLIANADILLTDAVYTDRARGCVEAG